MGTLRRAWRSRAHSKNASEKMTTCANYAGEVSQAAQGGLACAVDETRGATSRDTGVVREARAVSCGAEDQEDGTTAPGMRMGYSETPEKFIESESVNDIGVNGEDIVDAATAVANAALGKEGIENGIVDDKATITQMFDLTVDDSDEEDADFFPNLEGVLISEELTAHSQPYI